MENQNETELKNNAGSVALDTLVIPPAKKQIPNCYDCKHCKDLEYDAHKECRHPRINDCDRILTGFALMAGQRSQAMKRLNISGNETGIRGGWFYWPLNFDPRWLETCDGFETKGGEGK